MEIKGNVVKVLQKQTGEGKNGTWVKRSFIIETEGQYPKKVQISSFGDKLNVGLIKEGNILNVSIELESREYNGRWYTDVRAWKIELLEQSKIEDKKEPQLNTQNNDDSDLPF